MGNQSVSKIEFFIIVGTLILVILTLGILVFAAMYQIKMRRKKMEMARLTQEYRQGLIEAELEAKELEQRRLAIELHDDIGSSLTALKFSFVELPLNPEDKGMLNDRTQDIITKVRNISNKLLPTILEELGLLPAVKSLYDSLNNQVVGIKFKAILVNDPKHGQQSKEVELTIYRIIQELTNNIIKYAEATEVQLILDQNEEGLILSLTDNGKGFVPSKENMAGNSLGLKSIQNRIQTINATINYTLNNPGTTVIIKWKAEKQSK